MHLNTLKSLSAFTYADEDFYYPHLYVQITNSEMQTIIICSNLYPISTLDLAVVNQRCKFDSIIFNGIKSTAGSLYFLPTNARIGNNYALARAPLC
jgi:hypothetical protein